MNAISNILFIISNGLLIPVILLLLFFLVKALIQAAWFYEEYNRHKRTDKKMAKLLSEFDNIDPRERIEELFNAESGLFIEYVRRIAAHNDDEAYCEHELANYQVDVQKRLGKSRSLIKFGPMLGLMGTLIPMGPALVGLAQGDVASMAYNMQVAFATTVIGMVIAGIGLATLQVNQRYYARSLNDLEYVYRKICMLK